VLEVEPAQTLFVVVDVVVLTCVTEYPLTTPPPLELGAFHATNEDAFAAVPVTSVGAEGVTTAPIDQAS
jgi:hypothetical protein